MKYLSFYPDAHLLPSGHALLCEHLGLPPPGDVAAARGRGSVNYDSVGVLRESVTPRHPQLHLILLCLAHYVPTTLAWVPSMDEPGTK